MAFRNAAPDHPKTVGNATREATVAVDARIKDILARREAALQQARRAAQRLKRG
jgi:hypothetical protein